jgi:hypothetical protein
VHFGTEGDGLASRSNVRTADISSYLFAGSSGKVLLEPVPGLRAQAKIVGTNPRKTEVAAWEELVAGGVEI